MQPTYPLPLHHAAPAGWQTRWASFENPQAARGGGGAANRGRKGSAFAPLHPGERIALLDLAGSGLVTRIWATLSDTSPETLRSLRLEMTWDGAEAPAVSVPFGDFFGAGLGRLVPFANACFASPEGRSFNAFVPMPFRRSARIEVVNEGAATVRACFYDVDVLLGVEHPPEMLYFHAWWSRTNPNPLGEAFHLLPQVSGRGRFLGCHYGVELDPAYRGAWWGEGEFKAWIDGDGEHPTLCGSGEEDYIGTGYCQGRFSDPTQGCPLAGPDRFAMYRHHLGDPVYFHHGFRAEIGTLGGAEAAQVHALRQAGVPAEPVSLCWDGRTPIGPARRHLWRFLEDGPADLADPAVAQRGCVFQRCDDWSGTAYVYLDRPVNGLPPLAAVDRRTAAPRRHQPMPSA